MQVHAAVLPEPLEILGESIVVLPSTYPGLDLPIEGLDADAYDKILGLTGSGYHTYAACALGYRSSTDKYATFPKARYGIGDVLLTK